MALTLEDAMTALGYEPDQFSDYRVESKRVLMKLNRRPNEVVVWKPDGSVKVVPSLSLTIAKGEELLKIAAPEAIKFASESGIDLAYVKYKGGKLDKADVVAHIAMVQKRRMAKRAVVKTGS